MIRGTCRSMQAAFALTAIVTCASPAASEESSSTPIRVSLQWRDSSNPECLTQAQLEASVNELLSRAAFGPSGADAVVNGTLRRNPDGTRTARMELLRPDGTSLGVRELRSADAGCRTLREGVPIALSLMIDTRRMEVSLQLPRATPPPTPAEPRSKPRRMMETRLAQTSPPQSARWLGELDAAASLERGLLPGTSVATRIGAQWVHDMRWALRAQAGLVAPHTERYEAGGVTIWAWQLAVGGSVRVVEQPRFRADLTTLVETGELLSRGMGFEIQKTPRNWLLEGLVGVRGALKLGGGWTVGLAGSGGVPFVRQRITYRLPDGPEELSRSSPAFVRAELWVGLSAL